MKAVKITISILLVGIILFNFLYGIKHINNSDAINNEEGHKTVITLWHIDSFQGGVGSRRQFLFNVGTKFENLNKGVYISVESITTNTLNDRYSKNIYPDILSFGASTTFNDKFKPIESPKTFKGSMVNKKSYALPWCRGGYALFSKENNFSSIDVLNYSQQEGTIPLANIGIDNIKINSLNKKEVNLTFYDFLNGTTNLYLGTQRDAVRLINNKVSYSYKLLPSYLDLYQYVSILTTDNSKEYYCNSFINYLLSEEVQKSLNKISMLSNYYNVEHSLEILNEMQKTTPEYVLHPFIANNSEIEALSEQGALGVENAKNKLKNLCIIV